MPLRIRLAALLAPVLALTGRLLADPSAVTIVTNAAPDALTAQTRLAVAPGLKVELWAGEPLVQNITSFCFDNLGRAYVVETGRRRTSVFDIRGLQPWLDHDYSFRTVNDRENFLKRVLTPGDPDHEKFLGAIVKRGGFDDFNRDGVVDARDLEVESERIRLVWDADGKGHADHATTFADGFNSAVSGVAAGVLTQGTNVWFTCIPDLWQMKAADGKLGRGDGKSATPTQREKLLTGFGVHIAFGGHDLHGLIKGPDGRIYFSIADRGSWVTNREGRVIELPDCGAVFRCEPDGAHFEMFAKGLRNPQELCFDDFGNLWTGDNNADGGDKARWTLVLEGADYGWTMGWQWLPKLGAWNSERLWHTRESNTAASVVPPVAHIGHGPAGIAHYPGTGMPARYNRHFFMSDFPGGVRAFAVEPDGAFFKVVPESGADLTGKWREDNSAANLIGKVLWDLSPVDLAFPPGGGVTVADWVQGWDKTGKGRLWHVYDPALAKDPAIAETKRLLAEGMTKRREKELLTLLGHRDQRVRLEAQWELAGRGVKSFDRLKQTAFKAKSQLARIHALWAIGQIYRSLPNSTGLDELISLLPLLSDPDPEIQGQAAKMFAATRLRHACDPISALLKRPSPRLRFLALESLAEIWRADGATRWKDSLKARAAESAHDAVTFVSKDLAERVIPAYEYNEQPGYPAWAIGQFAASEPEMDPAIFHALSRLVSPAWAFDSIGERYPSNVLGKRYGLGALKNAPFAWRLRLACLIRMRELRDPAMARFLRATEPALVLETARAINDVPILEAMPALAGLLEPAALNRVVWGTNALNFTRDEWRTWILRRAVNANFRVGDPTNATALAGFALRAEAPESVRLEALDDLADWAKPPGRDKIVGLWRPLPARDPAPARAALAATWSRLVGDTSTNVVLACIRAGSALGLAGFPDLLAALNTHPSAVVRAEAVRLTASAKPVSLSDLQTTLANGKLAEQQAAFMSLGATTEPAAAGTLAEWVRQVTAGNVAAALQLDVLDAASKVSQSSGKFPALLSALTAWTNSLTKDDPLAPYRPALAGGDAAHGRKLFTERQDLACFRCHKLHSEGGEVGPELAGIGRTKGREYVLRSILLPNAEIAAGFENVVVTLKDGTSVAGVLKSESDAELVVQSPEDGRVTVKKAAIALRERGPSAMIEGLGELLSPRDLRDIVEALAE